MVGNANDNYLDRKRATSPKSCSMFESHARSGIKDFGDTHQIPFKSPLNYSLHLKIRAFDAYDPPALKVEMAPAQSDTVIPTAVDTTSIQFPILILQYSELET